MNCQEFWNTMPELADPAQGHLEQCPACAARLRSQRALKTRLSALAGQMSHVGAPARVESRLREAFRAHTGFPAYAPVRPHWPVLTRATLAAAVIGLAMFLVGQPPATNSLHRGEPPVTEMAVTEMAMTDAGVNGNAGAADSDFIVLPNVAEIGANEDVNMVRVEVPRSAMMAFGFEINPEQVWQPVQADVILGADGMARAVRFID